MKEYRPDMIRNIGIVAHARAGKTSLTEALLYDAGATDKLGRADDGTTVSDYNEYKLFVLYLRVEWLQNKSDRYAGIQ